MNQRPGIADTNIPVQNRDGGACTSDGAAPILDQYDLVTPAAEHARLHTADADHASPLDLWDIVPEAARSAAHQRVAPACCNARSRHPGERRERRCVARRLEILTMTHHPIRSDGWPTTGVWGFTGP